MAFVFSLSSFRLFVFSSFRFRLFVFSLSSFRLFVFGLFVFSLSSFRLRLFVFSLSSFRLFAFVFSSFRLFAFVFSSYRFRLFVFSLSSFRFCIFAFRWTCVNSIFPNDILKSCLFKLFILLFKFMSTQGRIFSQRLYSINLLVFYLQSVRLESAKVNSMISLLISHIKI